MGAECCQQDTPESVQLSSNSKDTKDRPAGATLPITAELEQKMALFDDFMANRNNKMDAALMETLVKNENEKEKAQDTLDQMMLNEIKHAQ
jgi:hypothetical protein